MSNDNKANTPTGRSSPLPLVAIALSAIALLATLFGPFRDYATQQRAVTDTATQVDSLNSRFDSVSTQVDKFSDDFSTLANRISQNELALEENDVAVDAKFSEASIVINKSLDDKLAVTRNSIDQALRSAREEAVDQFATMKQEHDQQLLALLNENPSTESTNASPANPSVVVLAQLNARLESLDKSVADNAQGLATLKDFAPPERDGGALLVNKLLEDTHVWLSLANDRLQLSGDVAFARTTLNVTQTRLASLDDEALASVQPAIKADLDRLDSVSKPDIQAIAQRLRDLSAEAKLLPFQSPPMLSSTDKAQSDDSGNTETSTNAVGKNNEQTDDDSKENGFLGELKSAVRNVGTEMKLGDLVTVKKSSGAYKTLLTPENRYFLRQNMYLMLQSAQLGLFRNDRQTFYDNLAAVKAWVREYYASDEQSVMDFIQSIEELANMEVQQDPVDITATIEALQQLNQERSSQ